MEVFFIYLIFVVVITIIGSSRGRGVGGFLMSLLLSPFIGLLWVILMPNLANKENTKICPNCAETIKQDAKVCRYCGCEK